MLCWKSIQIQKTLCYCDRYDELIGKYEKKIILYYMLMSCLDYYFCFICCWNLFYFILSLNSTSFFYVKLSKTTNRAFHHLSS